MQKKVPMWPVYAADALMFLAVFLMALPNIFLGEPLEAGQAFALALVVLIAMCLVLLPHFFAYRIALDSAKIEAQKRDEIFDRQIGQIFADLRTLRDSIMAQTEKIEASSSEIETLQISSRNLRSDIDKISSSASGLSSEISKLKADFAAANSALEGLKNSLEDFEKKSSAENGEHLKYLSGKLEKLSAESLSKFQILDDICAQLQALGDAYAESGESQDSEEENSVEEGESESGEDSEEEVEESEDEEPAEEGDSEIEEESGADEEDGEGFEGEESEGAEEEAEEEIGGEGGGESFGNDGDFGGLEEEQSEAETPAEEDSEQEEAAIEKQIEEPRGNPKWAGILDKALQNSQSSSTRDTVSKFIEKNKNGGGDSAGGGEAAQADLFDEGQLPRPRKPSRVKSGDTAVVVNAFLGIGNIPYVRGDGAGLSPDKGSPMDLLEIGKYQWKCEGMIADPIKISVWLNDEIPSNLGELILNPNETLEIDPSFE
ncbi:MAG: hypothetical protein J6T16_03600 [Opitutales bacterium]|nr:hypothetical protein [Opitutales bacterium]